MIIDGTYFNEDNIFSMKIFHQSSPIDNSIYYTNDDNTFLLYNNFLYNINGANVNATNIDNDAIDFIYGTLNSNNISKENIINAIKRYKYRNQLYRDNWNYSSNFEEDSISKIMDLYKIFISNIKAKHELKIILKLEVYVFNISIVSTAGHIETLPILEIKQNINLSDLTSDSIKDIINFNPETTIEQLQKKYFISKKTII